MPGLSDPVSETGSPKPCRLASTRVSAALRCFVRRTCRDLSSGDALERMRQEHAAFPDGERGRRLRGAIKRFADSAAGACLLAQQACAKIVCDNWKRFDGVRSDLLTWVVMPNQVRLMIRVIAGYPLSGIVNSSKSYSAARNSRLQEAARCGWLIIGIDTFAVPGMPRRAHATAKKNPVAAGLVARAQDWPWSSAAERRSGPAGRSPYPRRASVRCRRCASRQAAMRAWSPDISASGTSSPRNSRGRV